MITHDDAIAAGADGIQRMKNGVTQGNRPRRVA
jgi:hypothetical protein